MKRGRALAGGSASTLGEYTMQYFRVIILLSILTLLFARPKFIRDLFGDVMPIVLGFIAIAAIIVQFFLFSQIKG